jgi:hypothetical protein
MNKLSKAHTRKPPDFDMAASVIKESTSLTISQGKEVAMLYQPVLMDLIQSVERLNRTLENGQRLSAPNIARYFLVNPHLLEDFTIFEDVEKDDVQILYKGSSSKLEIRKAYNNLTAELMKVFGCKDISFKTMSEAILKEYDWRTSGVSDSIDISVLDVAYKFNKLFTVSDIRKLLPSLKLTTSEVESILLNNGYNLKTYKSSRMRYFQKPE